MKKILFCLQTMVFGGVETELITVLKRFDQTEYELSLLLFYEQDEQIINKIPKGVKIINLNLDKQYYFSSLPNLIKARVKKGQIFSAMGLAIKKALSISATPACINIEKIPQIEGEYDFAVCYHMHSPITLRYVADKVKAKNKIAWIHNEFTTTGFAIDKYDKWLASYDKIIGVSERVSNEFINKCPKYAQKTHTVHNVVDEENIKRLADDISQVDPSFINDKRFKIVTVGRFVEQKGFDIAIDACQLLKEQGAQISWYAIGYGKDEADMQKAVCEKKLQDNFIILGRKNNPYPYMKTSDLYVQPSRHEGYSITLREAKALKKLIVCTDFAGASEQITNGENGVIISGFDAKNLSDAILELYNDIEHRKKLQANINLQSVKDGWEKIQKVFME